MPATKHGGRHKPVSAAVCHGVAAGGTFDIQRARGKSVLFGRKTTALTWRLENSAWQLTKFLARFWDPDYYRTYREAKGEPDGYWSVEQEIKRALASEADFIDVPDKCRSSFPENRRFDARPHRRSEAGLGGARRRLYFRPLAGRRSHLSAFGNSLLAMLE